MISPDSAEIAAIREALAAAGVPEPPQGSPLHTLAWVIVALSRTKRPAPVEVRPARPLLAPWWREAVDRIDGRAQRGRCEHPEKKAYDPADLHEMRVMDRRRRDGAKLYPCRCGWSHLGATPATVAPTPPLPEVPAVWAAQRRLVALVNGSEDVIAIGRVVLHEHAPTVQVETGTGGARITWRADMIRALDEDIRATGEPA